jgi:phosphatidylglycerophosphate synthase
VSAQAGGRRGGRLLLPVSLTLLRLALGPLAIGLALAGSARPAFAAILVAGLLSDYFDGALARRLGVATVALRRLDSSVDVVFYLCLLAAAALLEPAVLARSVVPVGLLLASEALCIGASLYRFGVLPATHSYGAKFYGVALFTVFIGVLCAGWTEAAVWALGVIGLAANGEILLILLTTRTSPVDVSSFLGRRR